MLKISLLKNGISFLRNKQFRNSFRSAHVIADGRGRCYEHLNSSLKFSFENSESEIPLEKLNRSTLLNYTFPKICLHYTTEDCADHAASVGFANNLQVLPSFLIIFSNEILLGLTPFIEGDCVHAEQFINMFRPLKPHGKIVFTMKAVDLIDKVNGLLYVFHFNCRDDDGNDICFLENKAFEFGATGIGNKKCTPEEIIRPPERDADHIFEFQTVPFSSTFYDLTSDKLKESVFSPNHRGQYYGIMEKFSPKPHCHAQYYIGVIMQRLLNHFANGDVNLFRRVKTTFCSHVFPGDTLVTKAWKIKERIYFDCFAEKTGKNVLLGSYMDLNEKMKY